MTPKSAGSIWANVSADDAGRFCGAAGAIPKKSTAKNMVNQKVAARLTNRW